MKRKLGILIGIFLIMASLAHAAIYLPLPINGKIIGASVNVLEIEVTNLRTGKILIDHTTESGEYLIDWANSDDDGGAITKYLIGDQFKVSILSCAVVANECVQTLEYKGQSELFTTFDLTNVPLACPAAPSCDCGGGGGSGNGGGVYCSDTELERRCQEEICTSTPTCTEEECIKTQCPDPITCPTDTTPYTSCDSCCSGSSDGDCPAAPVGNESLIIFFTALISVGGSAVLFFSLFNNKIFLGKGTGMKTYRGRDGTLKIYHKHPGTRGYHNPDTVHRKPENHPKGMMDVKDHYQKNADGEWEYVA